MGTLEIQRRLKALGYDPGPLDGVRGRLTIRAVKAFQEDRTLAVDGIVGTETTAALIGSDSAGVAPPHVVREQMLPWYSEALRLKGLREGAGAADNPLLLTWAKRLGLAYAHDSTAWCGLFVAHCIAAALPDEALPVNPLGARRWFGFGRDVEPTLGAVLVFWRGARTGWAGKAMSGSTPARTGAPSTCSAATSRTPSPSPGSPATACSARAGRSLPRRRPAARPSVPRAERSQPTKHDLETEER